MFPNGLPVFHKPFLLRQCHEIGRRLASLDLDIVNVRLERQIVLPGSVSSVRHCDLLNEAQISLEPEMGNSPFVLAERLRKSSNLSFSS